MPILTFLATWTINMFRPKSKPFFLSNRDWWGKDCDKKVEEVNCANCVNLRCWLRDIPNFNRFEVEGGPKKARREREGKNHEISKQKRGRSFVASIKRKKNTPNDFAILLCLKLSLRWSYFPTPKCSFNGKQVERWK